MFDIFMTISLGAFTVILCVIAGFSVYALYKVLTDKE
jgi:hypothetical protein